MLKPVNKNHETIIDLSFEEFKSLAADESNIERESESYLGYYDGMQGSPYFKFRNTLKDKQGNPLVRYTVIDSEDREPKMLWKINARVEGKTKEEIKEFLLENEFGGWGGDATPYFLHGYLED
jgi:hypothetical protein